MSSIISDGIKVPKGILKTSGHWPEESPSLLVKVSRGTSWLLAIIYVITLAIELAKHFDDYELLCEQLSVMVPPTSFLVKLIFYRKERKHFLKLLQQLNLDLFNNYPNECELMVRKSNQSSTFIGISYLGICSLVITLYCVSPVFTKAETPVMLSYDFGPFKSLVYAFQVLSLYNVALNNTSLDILATDLMTIATTQMGILNKKIIGFNSEYRRKIAKKNEQEKYNMYTNNLKECAKHHNEIIRFVENLEHMFSIPFLVQYFSSGIVICNIGFQIVHTTPLSMQFGQLVFFFVTMMFQLFMYSWFGNEISIASETITNACYDSEWINCDLKIQKVLIIIAENSMKPLFLTAGKFTALSLTSFVTVVKTSYSYFALMQRLYGDTQP